MTGTLWELVLASAVFVLGHFLVSSTALRPALVGKLGESRFLGLYSLVAIVTLLWMVMAYNRAPFVELWFAGTGIRHLAGAVMLIAFLLVVGGLTVRNPTLVGGDKVLGEVTSVPGWVKITRHPMMWGFGLWALSHLAANGDLASVIFFGSFAILALVGTMLIDRKKEAALGESWRAFAGQTSNLPFAAILSGRTKLTFGEIGLWRPALGVAVYLIFLFSHEWLFGVWPLAVS